MPENKPTYKEENGTTRVGDFLRKIGKSDFLQTVVEFAKSSGLPFLDVVGEFITSSKEMEQFEIQLALKELEKDIEASKEISNRWKNDMISDSWLSKNIRPMVLIYSWVLITGMIILYTNVTESFINDPFIILVGNLAISVNVAYFGGREVQKGIQNYKINKK